MLLTALKKDIDEALAETVQVQKLQKTDASDTRLQQLEAELQRSLSSESSSETGDTQSM